MATQAHHSIFTEAECFLRDRISPRTGLERGLIREIGGPLSLMIPVRIKGSLYLVHTYLNPKWSNYRNGYEIYRKALVQYKRGRRYG